MELTAIFEPKPTKLMGEACIIERMLELSREDYLYFRSHLLEDQEFIKEHVDCMQVDEEGKWHCLLVLGEGMEDGILVESEGYSYARYGAHLPGARSLWNLHSNQAIKTQYENAVAFNEEMTEKAIKGHQDGVYRFWMEEAMESQNGKYLTKSFMEDMLCENPAFAHAEIIDDEMFLTVADEVLEESETMEPQMNL